MYCVKKYSFRKKHIYVLKAYLLCKKYLWSVKIFTVLIIYIV